MVSHNKGPSGGYRYRKPDLILLNRNVRHILASGKLRPRWHHVEAIVEVSASADPASMERQIVEKAALIFRNPTLPSIRRRSCHTRNQHEIALVLLFPDRPLWRLPIQLAAVHWLQLC